MNEVPRLERVPEDWNRALAIVAHPDDLEYGAAAAVARWTDQGKEIVYLLATRGEAGIDSMSPKEAGPRRAEEERRSAALVGVSQVEFLDHRDGVVEYGLPLRRDLALAIRKYHPEVVITLNHNLTWPGGGLNMADHRNVGLAVLDAVRDAGNRWVFTSEAADGAEPWTGVSLVLVSGSPKPTHGVDVTGDHFDRGTASLAEHKTYLEALGAFDSTLTFLHDFAKAAGKELGCELGVLFQVIRL